MALMEKQTRKWLASQASKRWDKQYGPFIGQKDWKEEVWQKLKSLGENPEPDLVDQAIGNKSWTRLTCSECGKEVEEVIQIGQEPDYESHTAWICVPCIKLAAELP